MAVGTRVALRHQTIQSTIAPIEVPREFIEVLAFEKFQNRGSVHGHDWQDWFAAEEELRRLFRAAQWTMEHSPSSTCLIFRAAGPTQVLTALRRYFQKPTAASIGGQSAQLRLVCPDDPTTPENSIVMRRDRLSQPTSQQLERAKQARSPISFLEPADIERLKGNLVALLTEGPEKGKVIASAPIDTDNPDEPRASIRAQIQQSKYRGCRYQLRQILETLPTD